MRRLVAALLLSIMILGGGIAEAQSGGSGLDSFDGSGTTSDAGIAATANTSQPGSAGTSPTGVNDLAGCEFFLGLSGAEAIALAGDTIGVELGVYNPATEDPDRLFNFVICPRKVFNGFAWDVWEQGDPIPQVVIDAVIREAFDQTSVILPGPDASPLGTRDVPMITQLPTWFAIPEENWQTATATASIPGLVSVTVTAVPTTTSWNPGDGGSTVTCEGRGVEWSEAAERSHDGEPPCGHTYTANTAGETLDLSVATTYDTSYTCAPAAACAGAAPITDITVAVTRPVYVTEVVGLLSR